MTSVKPINTITAPTTPVARQSVQQTSTSSSTTSSSSSVVTPQTKILDGYNSYNSTTNASGTYKGASVASDSIQPQHWAPTSALIGLGTIDYGAQATHFIGNAQNFASQIYSVGSMQANMNVQSIPDQWRGVGGATQWNSLNQAELEFASTVIQQLTVNPPKDAPPVVTSLLSSLSPYTNSANSSNSIPSERNNNPVADAQRQGGFNIEKAYIAKQQISKGYDVMSKFWGIAGDGEASELLGSSVMESVGSGISSALETVGMEDVGIGLLAGGADAIGGAAVVGAAIAGAEVVAGATAIGLGIYETYKAFGGTEDLNSITGKVSSGVHSVVQLGEKISHWFP